MIVGKAPVAIGDVVHALVTNPAGMKPLPVADGSDSMRAVPVVVTVRDGGRYLALLPTCFTLVPHVAANLDTEKGPITGVQRSRVVFAVSLPPGWKLVNENEEVIAEVQHPPDTGTGVEAGPNEIPELAGYDAGVFATDPDRLNENLRAMNKKPMPGQMPKG